MKKLFFSIFFFCLLFLSPSKITAQTVISGEHIKEFSSKIHLNQDGTIDVEEKIIYDFSGLQKHGIFRNIPLIKINKEGKKFLLNFENFTATDEDNIPYNFSKTINNQQLAIKIGDADKLITGLHTYIISYKVAGALTYFSDHDEFYWNVTGNEWQVPIANSSVEVVAPETLTNVLINMICYTGIAGSAEKNCTTSGENNSYLIKSNSVLYAYQGLTFALSFPKGKIAVLEPKEYISFWDTTFGKLLSKLIIFGIIFLALFWYIFLPVFIPLKWYLSGRDPRSVEGETRAWYDPPKDRAGQLLSPGETGTVIDEEANNREISATIISVAQKGYLKIVEKKKNKFSLVKTQEADTKLRKNEKEFFIDIFEKGDEFALDNNEMYEIAQKAQKTLYEQLVNDGTFPNNPQSVRAKYYALAGFALFTGNIFLAIIAFIFARVMPRKTLFGASQASVARSLKNFLTSQSRQLEFQAKNQMFFERLLPYAVAFGVEKVWANRFKDIQMSQPSWYEGNYGRNFTTAYFLSSLNSSFSKINSSMMTPTRSSSGFSSGFSSGGGFSGGGGGGGGGGSW